MPSAAAVIRTTGILPVNPVQRGGSTPASGPYSTRNVFPEARQEFITSCHAFGPCRRLETEKPFRIHQPTWMEDRQPAKEQRVGGTPHIMFCMQFIYQSHIFVFHSNHRHNARQNPLFQGFPPVPPESPSDFYI